MDDAQGQRPTQRALSGAYVERVRFAWERALPALPVGAFAASQRMVPGITSGLVALTDASAPRVLRLAREVAATLGFAEELQVWQTRSFEDRLNAQAMLPVRPFAIRLIGPVARLLSDGALRAMMGHELGHALAHRDALARSETPSWNFTAPPRGLMESWTLAMELTADRFALLACQDLEAAVHLELVSMTGDDPVAQGVVAADYLRECVARLERSEAPLLHGRAAYPSMELRLYASWLFSRTEVYRELVGAGSDELTLAAVDEALIAICEKAVKPLVEPPVPTAARHVASASNRSADADEDFEAQLQRLEREVAAERAGVDVDLERRFRELEERERRRKG